MAGLTKIISIGGGSLTAVIFPGSCIFVVTFVLIFFHLFIFGKKVHGLSDQGSVRTVVKFSFIISLHQIISMLIPIGKHSITQ